MSTLFTIFAGVWVALALPAFVGGVLAARSDRARRIARIATGLLMLVGGAVFNTAVLSAGGDYSGFADGSWSSWVTRTWEAVLVPRHVLFIGMLVAFEAAVGTLLLRGGRPAQLGLVGAMGFLAALTVFGPAYTVFPVVMLPALALLLRAERRASLVPGARREPPVPLAGSTAR